MNYLQSIRTYCCIVFMVSLITCPGHALAQERLEDRLVGTYKLLALQTPDFNGKPIAGPLGDHPVGQLIYGKKGSMCVSAMRPDRQGVASRDPQVIVKAFDGFVGYCGRYSVNEKEGTITHQIKISSIPEWIGDQKRFFSISGKRLTLKSKPVAYGGQETVNVLEWERID